MGGSSCTYVGYLANYKYDERSPETHETQFNDVNSDVFTQTTTGIKAKQDCTVKYMVTGFPYGNYGYVRVNGTNISRDITTLNIKKDDVISVWLGTTNYITLSCAYIFIIVN